MKGLDKQLLAAICADPDISEYLDTITPEGSRQMGAELIKEQASRKGISEIAAMNMLAPQWISMHRQALEVDLRLAEHLATLIKMCD